MPRIRCFLIEPAGRTALSLRRYSPSGKCDVSGQGYHNASTPLFEVAETLAQLEGFDRPVFHHEGPHTPEEVSGGLSNPQWPRACACGYEFQDTSACQDARQVFSESIYRRLDNGERMTLRAAPPGAMYWLTWMEGFFHPQLGTSPLCVITPGGEWVIDSRASNCTMADDYNQERHHCWIAHGTPPDVTVDKNGVSCAAGAGSIQAGSYHGFLRGGYLED